MDRKEIIKNIVELVEDKQFPAKRAILDYVLFLIEDSKERTMLEKYIEELYN